MPNWFDKHFSRKELKTTLLAGVIIFVVAALWKFSTGWAEKNVDTSELAQKVSDVADWLSDKWNFVSTYATDSPEIPRWVFVIIVLFAVVPILRAISRSIKSGSLGRAGQEAFAYTTEMTVGDFIRTMFDFKHADTHRKRWKEQRRQAAEQEVLKPELESEPEPKPSNRELLVLAGLLKSNWPDGYADMRVLAANLEMDMQILELAAHDLEEEDYVHISYGEDGTFIKIMPEGTRVALIVGIVTE